MRAKATTNPQAPRHDVTAPAVNNPAPAQSNPAAQRRPVQFAPIADEGAAAVERGLELLWRSRPLWPIEPRHWGAVIATVQRLEEHWGDQARGCGWTLMQLFGLDVGAPAIRREAMGAFFVAARCSDRVLSVAGDAMQLEASTGVRSRIYRTEPGPRAVLAWRLCELRSAPGVR